MDSLDRARPTVPYRVHHFVFEVSEGRPNWALDVVRYVMVHDVPLTKASVKAPGISANPDSGQKTVSEKAGRIGNGKSAYRKQSIASR